MLPGGAAAKILICQQSVTLFYFSKKFWPLFLHDMFGQLLRIRLIKVSRRDDRIRINIRSKLPDPSFNLHEILAPQSELRIPQLSFLNDFLRMTDPSFDSAGSGDSGAGQINLALSVAHPSAKITIRGGQSFFPTGQNAHMASQTGTTGGWADDCAGRKEYL